MDDVATSGGVDEPLEVSDRFRSALFWSLRGLEPQSAPGERRCRSAWRALRTSAPSSSSGRNSPVRAHCA